jgi:purine-binding chemotaxis protein CheW
MGPPADTSLDRAPAVPTAAGRAVVAERVRQLEQELSQAQVELATMGGELLPGMHLVVEAAGRRGLLAASRVLEVVRLVAMEPIPNAPPALLGTFVCRGVAVAAVDLAALLGAARVPAMDAQIIILAGAPPVGLVVDRIRSLRERPVLHGAPSEEIPGWQASRLVVGFCTVGGEVLPLLDPGPVAAAVREELG